MSYNIDHFIGGPFVWFTGVVEDILDPEQMGRVRVRCFGFHSDNRDEIPVSALPWAVVITPVTNAAMTGIGQSATGVLRGSWVVGFFRDGRSAQDPIVIGTVPSMNTGSDPRRGFSDPYGVYPHRPGEIDTPVESTSRFDESSNYIARADSRQDNVEIAISPNCSKTDPLAKEEERSTWSVWRVEDVVKPTYPFNHSHKTLSGHLFEVDDTQGARRLLRMHAAGSYEEINDASDRTLVVRGKNCEVIFGDDNVYVKGSLNLTIDGDVRQLVKGNYHLEVEGDYTQNIKGNSKVKIGQAEYREVQYDSIENIGKNFYTHVSVDRTLLIDKDMNVVIGGARDQTIKGDDSEYALSKRTHYVASDSTTTIGGSESYFVMKSREAGVGEDETVTIIKNRSVSIGGNSSVVVSGNETIGVRGLLTEQVEGAVSETYKNTQTVNITGAQTQTATGDIKLTAPKIYLN